MNAQCFMIFSKLLYLQSIKKKTLISFGAKINLDLKQLILPIKLSMDEKYIGLKIITPKTDNRSEENHGVLFNEYNLPKHQPWLLGYQFARNHEKIILTATVADALIVTQNFSVPALCLPSKDFSYKKFSNT